jgi:hypothetical protein
MYTTNYWGVSTTQVVTLDPYFRRNLQGVVDLKGMNIVRIMKHHQALTATDRRSSHLGAKGVGGGRAGANVGGKEGAEHGLVDSAGATGGRELEPEDKGSLEDVVEGEVIEDKAGGKRLEEGEDTKDAPVGEPVARDGWLGDAAWEYSAMTDHWTSSSAWGDSIALRDK